MLLCDVDSVLRVAELRSLLDVSDADASPLGLEHVEGRDLPSELGN